MTDLSKTLLVVDNEVWVSDPKDSWVLGKVTKLDADGKSATVKVAGESDERSLAISDCHRVNDTHNGGGEEDMTKLPFLHEPGVLRNLQIRYDLDEIGEPVSQAAYLYGPHMMDQYKGVRLGELSPHVFAVADSAYRFMVSERKSQSILVSGESGAGKTETTKLIMMYLAYMGGRRTEGRSVEQQVLESNPLLEAFGNAKTIRNDNSSRFGKYVEIQFDKDGRISGAAVRTYLLEARAFDKDGRISGAAVRTYLLERSRLVQITDPERNYHIFYQLCAGASPEEVESLKLKPASEFHYLNQSKCYELSGVDNAEEFARTRRAMSIVGITEAQQDSVWRIVAAVLHLGNVKFAGEEEAKFADEASEEAVGCVAALLHADRALLDKALLIRTIITKEQTFERPMSELDAVASRDSLAKTLYSRLFDWLVGAINDSIGQDAEAMACIGVLDIYGFESFKKNYAINDSIGQDADAMACIGVLDIYGFESFKKNSFEQFCINLANEKLQQHFNQHVFKMEQEEYEKEKIDWSYIEFVDNQDV
eukprot:CAMPEP_0114267720 /NCGR_PEP_ID=MMETSP0058-20121206/25492_1 /TAXON_ID=36894 /ORGANISM="Pyramimonas parkeae, CCMP726" /LENGTH=536 /DNA_ID=CAMNT_0001385683 /DNA_START=70 /DNA_END=1678 /DNA_ORIENTATION=-